MSEALRVYELNGWVDPVDQDFLGSCPVKFVDTSNGWKECSHGHGLSSACTIIASSIFGEKDRDAPVLCSVCRGEFTEVIPYHEMLESTLTITETVEEEKPVVITTVVLQDGRTLKVKGQISEKKGHAYADSTIVHTTEKTHYEGTVEICYELRKPNEAEPFDKTVDTRTYQLDGPYVPKPTVKMSYDQALKAWDDDKRDELLAQSSKMSEVARPILSAEPEENDYAPLIRALLDDEPWEDQDYAPQVREFINDRDWNKQLHAPLVRALLDKEPWEKQEYAPLVQAFIHGEEWIKQRYAPLVSALMIEFIGEERQLGKSQLHMENARRIRDKVRYGLGLPLGYVPEDSSMPPVKPLHPSRSSVEDSSNVTSEEVDSSQCCLAQLGAYNVLIATVIGAALIIYGYSKGMFDNLIHNLRGSSDDQNMRQKTTVPIHTGIPSTPYNPGGMGGIRVY
ncbi:MAG: hypothetical protein KDK56_08305 [Simkania sp.]|nr:hypothetical protein [Simkania sp.]MCP5490893.1 hypothetical protein [Chlamydiales bacterium]